MKQKRHVLAKLLFLATMILCLVALLASCGECDHNWSEWTISEQPTCEAAGSQSRACSSCGEKQTENLAALGHQFDNYVTADDATCQSDATQTATCVRCQATDTKKVKDSKNPDKHAGTELRYERVDDASHQVIYACCDAIARTEAHAWGNGVTDPNNAENTLYTCQDCKATKSVPSDAHVHSAERVAPTASTCTTYGNIEHWFCEGCNTYFADANLTQVITEAQTKLNPAHTSQEFNYVPHATNADLHEKLHACCDTLAATEPHDHKVASTTAATCEQNGTVSYLCVCGHTYTEDNALATGHNKRVFFRVDWDCPAQECS